MTTPVGALTFAEIAARVKRQFGDEVGAQVTDLDIARWIDDAQRDIAENNNLLQGKATTPIVAGQNNYELPADLLTLHSLMLGSQNLASSTLQEVDQLMLNNTAQGTAQLFYIWDNSLNLYPVPDASGASLTLYYTRQPTPVPRPADVPTPTFIPELPARFHNRIVEYCIAKAKELDDDSAGHDSKMQQFRANLDQAKEGVEVTQAEYPYITYVDDGA